MNRMSTEGISRIVTTQNGSYSIDIGKSFKAVNAVHTYFEKHVNSTQTPTRSTTSDRVGATAGVVGAICSVAGLTDTGDESDIFSLDVKNLSDYGVQLYGCDATGASTISAPTALITGEGATLAFRSASDEGFSSGNNSNTKWVIGTSEQKGEDADGTPIYKQVYVELNFKMVDHDGHHWGLMNINIDGASSGDLFESLENIGEDAAICINFKSNDDNKPSFSIHTYTVFYASAQSFLLFAPEYQSHSNDVAYIEGIGDTYAERLITAGVETVEQLLAKGATEEGRRKIAANANISEKLIRKWTGHADLMQLSPIGNQFAELLFAADITSVNDLAQANVERLTQKMAQLNSNNNIAPVSPSMQRVSKWIEFSKQQESAFLS